MVALAIHDMAVNVHQDTQSITFNGGQTRAIPVGRRITLDIRGDVQGEDQEELKELLSLDRDSLEIVIRRRAPRPQDVQSAAEPPTWRVTPQKTTKKAKQAADVPETQPEPEEPTTAQTVEEFGSWG